MEKGLVGYLWLTQVSSKRQQLVQTLALYKFKPRLSNWHPLAPTQIRAKFCIMGSVLPDEDLRTLSEGAHEPSSIAMAAKIGGRSSI